MDAGGRGERHVAGGLAGLVLMGPVVGLLAAGGAAFAASTNKGKAGQLARATGEVLLDEDEIDIPDPQGAGVTGFSA